ncbi:MAG TPA: hypothetical protein VMH22_07035 [bacterium]|nr:hypothetical protein [bacterium]
MKLCVLASAFCLLTSIALGADVGIDTIVSPTGTVDSGVPLVPKCAVHAYTGTGQVDVHFVIPEAGYHDSLTLPPLPPGLVDSATFKPWAPNARDSMTAVAWVHCSGDTYPQNDTFRLRFFVDVLSGIEESPRVGVRTMRPVLTMARGMLFLPSSTSSSLSCLLDVSGRKVMGLHPGANGVSRLAPGVYFERSAASGEPSAVSVRKVIITR